MASMKNTTDLTERYLYAVTKRLPKEQRTDIEKELSGLIEDMLADRSADSEPTQQDVEAVLVELGKPSELAAKYRGSKDYLIGPDLYGTYLMLLKIVLAAVAGGLTVALVVEYIVSPGENPFEDFANYLSNVFSGLLQVFAWVTVGFAIAQKYNAKIDDDDKKWNPAELPEVPAEKAKIKKGEAIAGIIFTVIFMIVVNAASNLLGVFYFSDGKTFIPLFDTAVFISMLPIINAVFGLSILKEFFKLMVEKYNGKLAVLVSLANAIAFVLMLYVFLRPEIWNAGFIESLQAMEGFVMPTDFDLAYHWTRIPKYFVGLTAVVYLFETVTTVYKAVQFSVTKK